MRDWNLLVTIVPGPQHVHQVLAHLRNLGRFVLSQFMDVCLGHVRDVPEFLDRIQAARVSGQEWASAIGRVIPLQCTFTFAPESLEDQLKDAVVPLVAQMRAGSFHVRLERRGMAGKIPTQQIERAVADHIFALASAQGIPLETDFDHPDYVVVAETVGERAGVALLTRELSSRYPFVHVR